MSEAVEDTAEEQHTVASTASVPSVPQNVSSGKSDLTSRAKAFLIQHHLPIGLLLAVLIGFLAPGPGIFVGQAPINTISICGIFFISGLQLRTQEIKQAMGEKAGVRL